MSTSMEERYKAILNPPKNADDAINVDLAEQLLNYLQTYVKEGCQTNFNSAALLIQGSSNLYSKKVDYLYNLCSNIHESLTKQSQRDEPTKKKDPKERAQRQSKTLDPFCSTKIKVGKHLSCLRKKNVAKVAAATKKSSKKTAEKKHAFVPVDLLPLECEEKGDVFYDTRGEAIGNKNDYTLNKCRITTSGWLLLPTVSPENIVETKDLSSLSNSCGASPVDEGYPASSGCPSSPPTAPSSQAVSLSQPGSSQQTDEGIGSFFSTPSDGMPSQPEGSEQVTPMDDDYDAAPDVDMENVPLEDDFPTEEELAAPNKPQRRSVRTALMQLQQAERERPKGLKEDLFAVRRPIEKNSTVCLPPGMRNRKPSTPKVYPASVYCARTFFSVDNKFPKNDLMSLQVTAFANNTKFLNRIKSIRDTIKAAKANNKKKQGGIPSSDEEEEVDVEQVVEPSDEEDHSFAANPGPIDDDFDIDEDPLGAEGGEENPLANAMPNEGPEDEDMEAGPSFEFDGEEFDRVAEEQMALFRDDLQTVEQTTEMTGRVRKWEKVLKPFLENISKREKFDINLYGSHILNAFDENNRRQTLLFRRFCEGMEKYQVHRYFLALLPLANVGNVSISNEPSDDGQGLDIAITLLSRKMHHMELEEFGHNEGHHN